MTSSRLVAPRVRTLVVATWLAAVGAVACTCQPAPPIPDAAPADAGRRDVVTDAAHDACVGCLDVVPPDLASTDHSGGDRTSQDLGGEDAAADARADDVEVEDAPIEDGGADDAAPDAGPLTAPAAPTGLQASAGALVRLRFEPAARADRYQALVSESPGGPYRLAGPASPSTELWLEGLAFNLSHAVVVRALNAVGNSPLSDEVLATPRDGVSALRGSVAGVVRQGGLPVAGAEVRLYDEVDHGVLLAQAVSDADGGYQLEAPSGLYRGLIAGLDELPQDGNAFELGYDSVGWTLADAAGQPFVFEVRPAHQLDGVDVELGFAWLERRIVGSVEVGAGWPLGRLVVLASAVGSPLRPARATLDAPGSYDLAVEPDTYRVQAFLDVDGDGEPGLNEPRSRVLGAVDVTVADASGQDLTIPAADTLGGTLRGADGWSVVAVDEGATSPSLFTRAAPDGVAYELVVPAGRSYRVLAFIDQDGSGRRSLLDVDGDALAGSPEETWLEPGLPPRTAVAAGSSGVDFAVDLSRRLRGTVVPAMQRWTVIARDPAGDLSFATRAAPDGSFALAVAPHDAYLVFAFVDADGDGRRTPWLEPAILHSAVVDAALADVDDIAIVQRQISGTALGSRAAPALATNEVLIAQQLVQGYGGGLLCASPVEIASATRVMADAAFVLQVGALGSGAGSQPWTDCAPLCTGVTLVRYLDQGGDYSHLTEGCVAADPLVYPASVGDPTAEAVVLDTSAGDLGGLSF